MVSPPFSSGLHLSARELLALLEERNPDASDILAAYAPPTRHLGLDFSSFLNTKNGNR